MQRWLPFFATHQLVVFTDNSMISHGLLRRSVQGLATDPLYTITLLAALKYTNIHTDAQNSVPKEFETAHRTTLDKAPKKAAPDTAPEMTLDTTPYIAPQTVLDTAPDTAPEMTLDKAANTAPETALDTAPDTP